MHSLTLEGLDETSGAISANVSAFVADVSLVPASTAPPFGSFDTPVNGPDRYAAGNLYVSAVGSHSSDLQNSDPNISKDFEVYNIPWSVQGRSTNFYRSVSICL
jgi:hypothetical protein